MTIRYQVSGLDCAHCAQGLENAIAALPGVKEAKVNFIASTLTVKGDFSPEKINNTATLHGASLSQQDCEKKEYEKNSRKKFIYGEAGISAALIAIYLIGGWLGYDLKWALPFAAAFGGGRNFIKGLKNLLALNFNTDVLMALAVIGAFAIGQWSEGALVAFLFGVSEILENYIADKARKNIGKLIDSSPETAVLITESGEQEIPATAVKPGQRLLLRAGEKVPVDAKIIKGISFIDQANITGEPIPREVAPGDKLFSGTLNQNGVLELEATQAAADSTMSKIIELVEEAQGHKSNFQGMVERFAKYYTPAVFILAILIAAVPPLLGGAPWTPWIYRGLTLLVLSCPCALVITSPVVLASAISNAAKRGILIKGGNYLEALASVDIAVFDKTGTLSEGKPELTEIRTWDISEPTALSLGAGLGKSSNHPLSLALSRRQEQEGLEELLVENMQNLPGEGNKGDHQGETWYLGNRRLFENISPQIEQQWQAWAAQGCTVSALGNSQGIKALFAFKDQARPETVKALKRLKELGIQKTIILSGDTPSAAQAFAESCGADEAIGGLLPADKVREVNRLKEQGQVLMVGDGINDAPALASADVSAAMGVAGSAAALEAADIALMNDDLSQLAYGISLSKKAVKVIKQNIAFAICLKLLVLLAIFPGWLSLWLAIVSDMGANILVTLNGIRLLSYKE